MKCAVLGVSAWMLLAARQDSPKPETFVVKRDTLTVELELDGTLEPAERHVVPIRFDAYSGDLRIASIVPHGARVRKADPLVQFDSAKWKEALAAAEAERAASAAALERCVEELRLGEIGDALALQRLEHDASLAEERLRYYKAEEIALRLRDVEMSVARWEDRAADQKDELEQLEKMYKSEELTSATAEIVLKRARRDLERTKTQLETARLRAERTKAHEIPMEEERLRLEARQAAHRLEEHRRSAPVKKKEREAAAARARVAAEKHEETLAKLRKDEAAMLVPSPADGTAYYGRFENGAWVDVEETRRLLRPGERVQASQVQITIVPGMLCVRTALPEANVGDIMAGLPATVMLVAFPDLRVAGKTNDPELVGGRKGDAFDLRIDLESTESRLVPGLRARVKIFVQELKDVLVVPLGAITEKSGKTVVKVLEGGEGLVREVAKGRSNGKMVEIKSGLKEGEEVVVGGMKP